MSGNQMGRLKHSCVFSQIGGRESEDAYVWLDSFITNYCIYWCRSLKQLLDMEGVSELALTFGCLELDFCANSGGVDRDDVVTDKNKVWGEREAESMSVL